MELLPSVLISLNLCRLHFQPPTLCRAFSQKKVTLSKLKIFLLLEKRILSVSSSITDLPWYQVTNGLTGVGARDAAASKRTNRRIPFSCPWQTNYGLECGGGGEARGRGVATNGILCIHHRILEKKGNVRVIV